MVLVKHLISPASLPAPPTPVVVPTQQQKEQEQLSVLSYNVLLPNSEDGWWTYKMYMPPLPSELQYASSWEYRRDLLKRRIQLINADVVCLQEVSPKSFECDFDFMWKELGYDQHELFKKGRFRPATFWKSSHCKLVLPPVHKDRCLLTAFQIMNDDDDSNNNNNNNNNNNEDSAAARSNNNNNSGGKNKKQQQQQSNTTQNWYVCNCHLQAGKQGGRRVRQIHEAMRGILTMARKLKEPQPEINARTIVCGDFNGDEECGAVRYLEDGYVDETFLEDNEQVSSGKKELPLNKPLIDTMMAVERRKKTTTDNNDEEQQQPPATLVVPELMSIMMEEATYDNPIMSQTMKDTLERIYKTLATDPDGQMSYEDVKQWLIKINKQYGRGDEYREAAKQMGYVADDSSGEKELSYEEKKKLIKIPENGVLSLDGFIEIYRKELINGKFWGIAHDLSVLGDPLPDGGVFTARYDRMYHNSNAIQPIAILDTVSSQPCPNIEEPSDHLPVAATFCVGKNN